MLFMYVDEKVPSHNINNNNYVINLFQRNNLISKRKIFTWKTNTQSSCLNGTK